MQHPIQSLYELGFSVVPMNIRDGRKVPALPAGYKDNLPVPLELSMQHKEAALYGVLCGGDGGNFMCLDFDLKNANGEDVYTEYLEYLKDTDLALYNKVQLCMARTVSGGYHIYYKTLSPRKGHAYAHHSQPNGKFQPVIETRGTGQIAVLPPSQGYSFTDPEMSLSRVPRLTDAEEEILLNLARTFDQKPVQEYTPSTKSANTQEGDGFLTKWQAEQDFHSLLLQDGYHLVRQTGKYKHYSRPSAKNKRGVDATLIDDKFFYPFSSSISDLPETEKAYSLYRYYGFTRYPMLPDDQRWKHMVKQLSPTTHYPQVEPTPTPPAPAPTDERIFNAVLKYWRDDVDITTENFIKQISNHEKIPLAQAKEIVEKVKFYHADEKGTNQLKGHAKVVNYIKSNYILSTNRIKGTTVIFKKNGEKTNWNKSTIYNELLLAGVSTKMTDVNAIWDDPKMHSIYNPIKDYFEALKKPTDDSQSIKDLVRFITFSDATPVAWAVSMLRKHMIRTVRQVYDTGYANRYCMTLASRKEKIGKSRFVDFLNPLGMEYTATAREDNKDQLVKIVENLFLVFDEIDKFSASDSKVAWLKNFISLQYIQERKSFRLDNEAMKRNATIWATTNRPFLDAEHENSRFIVLSVKSIDWKGYSTMIKLDDLWAEAYYAYLNNEPDDLTQDEEETQYKLQEDWNVYRDAYHVAKVYIKHADEKVPAISLVNQLEYYQIAGRKAVEVTQLERALSKLGFSFVVQGGIKMWSAAVDMEAKRSAIFSGSSFDYATNI